RHAEPGKRNGKQEPHFTKRLHIGKPVSIGRLAHLPRPRGLFPRPPAEKPHGTRPSGGSSMKFRILVLALVTALLGASVALAKDSPGKGPRPTTGPGCKPSVGLKLKGTLANDPATGDTSFDM